MPTLLATIQMDHSIVLVMIVILETDLHVMVITDNYYSNYVFLTLVDTCCKNRGFFFPRRLRERLIEGISFYIRHNSNLMAGQAIQFSCRMAYFHSDFLT